MGPLVSRAVANMEEGPCSSTIVQRRETEKDSRNVQETSTLVPVSLYEVCNTSGIIYVTRVI